MSSGWIVALEIALVLGVALTFAVRELRSLDRLKREREAARRDGGNEGGTAGGGAP